MVAVSLRQDRQFLPVTASWDSVAAYLRVTDGWWMVDVSLYQDVVPVTDSWVSGYGVFSCN